MLFCIREATLVDFKCFYFSPNPDLNANRYLSFVIVVYNILILFSKRNVCIRKKRKENEKKKIERNIIQCISLKSGNLVPVPVDFHQCIIPSKR